MGRGICAGFLNELQPWANPVSCESS